VEDGTYTLTVQGSKDAAEAIKTEVDARPGSQSQLIERRNLDGDTALWLVIANLGIQALPHILDFLKDYLATRRVTSIKVGDIEIKNPTAADLELLRRRIDKMNG
jgi:hypothetical protein